MKRREPGRDWILPIHQLPPKPTNLRVRAWRKLQRLGAVAIKNSVYVLPLTENPRLFFMHFWADDDAQKLARGLRAALDRVNVAKGQPK